MTAKGAARIGVLHDCPGTHSGGCFTRCRTRKALCRSCQSSKDRNAKEVETLRNIVGTTANMGVTAFLASLATPDGFTRGPLVQTWRQGHDGPGLQFTGHDGQTTIQVWMDHKHAEDLYSPGSGHTYYKTSHGEFSCDRIGVEDSFYVYAKDTAKEVDAKVREQVASVLQARARDETAVKVPFVGYIVQPERRDEIAAKLKAGGTHSFTPSGFGTGYLCSANPRRLSAHRQVAPQAMADFFGVAAIYYDTLDCD